MPYLNYYPNFVHSLYPRFNHSEKWCMIPLFHEKEYWNIDLNQLLKTIMMRKIYLPGKSEFEVYDVVRIESCSNYSKIYVSTRRHPIVVAKILSYFEESLPGELFTRVHRSHLVNKNFICRMEHCQEKGTRLILSNGEAIKVSRRKKSDFIKQWMGNRFLRDVNAA